MPGDELPQEQLNKNAAKTKPMRSFRLQGQSLSEARKRLLGAEKQPGPSAASSIHGPELAAIHRPSTEPLHKSWRDHWNSWSKRKKITVSSAAGLVLIGIILGLVFSLHHKKPQVIQKPSLKVEAAQPTTVASPLTGVQVEPKLAARPVTGVMVENSVFARPQSGLQSAGVVYEAIAEGGITRFLALYQEATPQYIGPVRSLRPYFLDFAAAYQASIAHVGGSPEALARVRNGHYRDIDEFFNAGSYWRINSRYAPHNVYTSFAKLDALNKSKHYTSSKFTPWQRKSDQKSATPTAAHIDFQISSEPYYVHYKYDQKSNTYIRSEGGAPHREIVTADGKKTTLLHPKVVIALVMSYHLEADDEHSFYGDIGSGQAYVFQDGGLTRGSWSKSGASDMFTFKDTHGKTIALDAGQTWVTIVSSPSQVISKP